MHGLTYVTLLVIEIDSKNLTKTSISYMSQVLFLGPVGYVPTTLPLHHSNFLNSYSYKTYFMRKIYDGSCISLNLNVFFLAYIIFCCFF